MYSHSGFLKKSLDFLDRNCSRIIWTAGLISMSLVYAFQPSENLTRYLSKPVPYVEDPVQIKYLRALQFIRQYKDEIVKSSNGSKGKVPVEIISAAIISENPETRRKYEDFKDFWAKYDSVIWVYNHTLGYLSKPHNGGPTLGPGQVKVCTAVNLDKIYKKPPKTSDELETILEDPVENITYVTMTIANAMERRNGAIRKKGIFGDTHILLTIGSEYNEGSMPRALEETAINRIGLRFVTALAEIDFQEIFRDNATITAEQQERIKQDIEEIINESG